MENINKVQKFILDNIVKHPSDISSVLAKEFGFSRQRAHQLIAKEVRNGNLIKTGSVRWTKYFLARGKHIEFTEEIKPDLDEYVVWSKYIKPMISSYPDNIQNICAYGFTEIFNNAIDHSQGNNIFVKVEIDNNEKINITILDNGVGIFEKIKKALNLNSAREAILHLSKGKFTTDPKKHTGEGIFFTSRVFDDFSILSNSMYYQFENEEWLLSLEKNEEFGRGTLIKMIISSDSKKSVKDIMDKYANQEIGFGKTIVGVALSADPNDPHISRSQAKRLLAGLEKFKIVVLNFNGVESVGQAFIDEIFRVFKNEHPDIKIGYSNTNNQVKSMIERVASDIKNN